MPTPNEPDLRVEHYMGYLLVVANTLIGSQLGARLDPGDVVQDTMAEAYSSRHTFKGSCPEQFKGWLRAILITTFSDATRWHRCEKRNMKRDLLLGELLDQCSMGSLGLAADESTPSQKAQRKELIKVVADAIERLPAPQRQAITLIRIEGMPMQRAAQVMGKSEPSVAGHLRRGLTALRADLGSENCSG